MDMTSGPSTSVPSTSAPPDHSDPGPLFQALARIGSFSIEGDLLVALTVQYEISQLHRQIEEANRQLGKRLIAEDTLRRRLRKALMERASRAGCSYDGIKADHTGARRGYPEATERWMRAHMTESRRQAIIDEGLKQVQQDGNAQLSSSISELNRPYVEDAEHQRNHEQSQHHLERAQQQLQEAQEQSNVASDSIDWLNWVPDENQELDFTGLDVNMDVLLFDQSEYPLPTREWEVQELQHQFDQPVQENLDLLYNAALREQKRQQAEEQRKLEQQRQEEARQARLAEIEEEERRQAEYYRDLERKRARTFDERVARERQERQERIETEKQIERYVQNPAELRGKALIRMAKKVDLADLTRRINERADNTIFPDSGNGSLRNRLGSAVRSLADRADVVHSVVWQEIDDARYANGLEPYHNHEWYQLQTRERKRAAATPEAKQEAAAQAAYDARREMQKAAWLEHIEEVKEARRRNPREATPIPDTGPPTQTGLLEFLKSRGW